MEQPVVKMSYGCTVKGVQSAGPKVRAEGSGRR